jgi:8-oxo-dGTP pyrophosphatase MutT (NUDIX family)
MNTIIASGGIVYRVNVNAIEVKLILTHKNRWSLPKGRLELNETIEQAAIREIKEECGVEAKLLKLLGIPEWQMRNGDTKIVHIYLAECVSDNEFNDPDKEILKAEWKTLDEAVRLVDFPPMRKMLIYAARVLDAEKASSCTHCFNTDAILLDWCELCLVEAKKHLELRDAKKALKKI